MIRSSGCNYNATVGRSRCGIKGIMLKVCYFRICYLISLEKRALLNIRQDMVQCHQLETQHLRAIVMIVASLIEVNKNSRG